MASKGLGNSRAPFLRKNEKRPMLKPMAIQASTQEDSPKQGIAGMAVHFGENGTAAAMFREGTHCFEWKPSTAFWGSP